MKYFLIILFGTFYLHSEAQPDIQQLGCRHLQFKFKEIQTEVLVFSEKHKENEPRPIFFFCQGSLPIPLILYDDQGPYGTLPFSPEVLSQKFHIIIVGKPGVPLMQHIHRLQQNFTIPDTLTKEMEVYVKNNHLDFYVERNHFVLKKIATYPWAKTETLVVAGHSEGATVAAKMAMTNKKIDALIFASGNPLGRIMSMIQKSRSVENTNDSIAHHDFDYLKHLVEVHQHMEDSLSYAKTDYSFSIPPMEYMLKRHLPVLVTYGTKDYSTPFNDYFRAYCILNKIQHISFQSYHGLDHNFFRADPNGPSPYQDFNWNKVAGDWSKWIESKLCIPS